MKTDIKALINLCEQELSSREYRFYYHRKITRTWEELVKWMQSNNCMLFDESTGFQYCREAFGSTVLSGVNKSDRLRLRAIRMLISFQRDGDFEFRTPSVLREFKGQSGGAMEDYLGHLRESTCLAEATVSNRRFYLWQLNTFLEDKRLTLDDLNVEVIADFFANHVFTPATQHNCISALKLFLRYAADTEITSRDCSINILPDNYNRHRKLPTTYNEEEIKKIICAVERSSAIGKRDYLVLLLASEYGWRSSDIVNFRFEHIDWDKSIISFVVKKTGVYAQYPLLSSVGNAIIDYLKHGRPVTDVGEIIVACNSGKRGKKLSTETIHSIVTKYIKKANISNWCQKKHGPHALRHSLASKLLQKNVPLPVISSVLDHKHMESAKAYLTIDLISLRQCAIPAPRLRTDVFEVLT